MRGETSLRLTASVDNSLTMLFYVGRAVIGYAGRLTDDIYVGNLLSPLEAIDSGTTTILDWSHAVNSLEHADAAVQALLDSGIRAVYAYGPRAATAPG
jgi:5-methylthioadenosine/S-adenosylhomocysteine deaminase